VEKKLPEALRNIRENWAGGQKLTLMFQDEARFGRISDIRRCWAPYPVRPLCQAMMVREYTYVFGAIDVMTGKLDSLILPYATAECMQYFLDEVSARHPTEKIVMVVDNASWHRSKSLKPPQNIYLLPLPPYAPELNPIEHVWDEIREKSFHNRVFKSIDALTKHLAVTLKKAEDTPEILRAIVAWPWIINALMI
jgi:DDE superfamily endonuclease